jgi:hypothetical protein
MRNAFHFLGDFLLVRRPGRGRHDAHEADVMYICRAGEATTMSE